MTTPFASVVVEIDGGRGFVEQRAQHPAGDSVAPCAHDTSDEWYFADGFTVDGSIETLVLTNPYDDAAVVDLIFATEAGESTPAAFQGFTILPQSVETIPIADLGARDEPVIAVKVAAERGRLVVGRAQHYLGGGRLGYDVSLAAPALRDQWWFADGEAGEGISETFAIYNPTDDDVQVDVVFLGIPVDALAGDNTIDVPARQVVVYDPGASGTGDDGAAVAVVPPGRHSSVFSTLAEPSIVVERILTRPAGDSVATSVVLGAPPRVDGYVALALAHRHRPVGADGRGPRRLQRRQRRRDRHDRSGRTGWSVGGAEPDRRADRGGPGDHDRPRRPGCRSTPS